MSQKEGEPTVRIETPVCDFGRPAPDFRLPGVDGKTWTLNDARGKNGLLVMFICNHCPYVRPCVTASSAMRASCRTTA